jgi:hypothetical protein
MVSLCCKLGSILATHSIDSHYNKPDAGVLLIPFIVAFEPKVKVD